MSCKRCAGGTRNQCVSSSRSEKQAWVSTPDPFETETSFIYNTLELSKIIKKVQIEKRWDNEIAALAEKWYRRFLEVALRFPDIQIAPHGIIDAIWHGHILDTPKYYADCIAIFGSMLHHIPTYGESDSENDARILAQTHECFRKLFGEDYSVLEEHAMNQACSTDCCTD